MFAIAGLTAWEVEDIRVAQPGQPFEVGQFYADASGCAERVEGPNYFSTTADVLVEKDGRVASAPCIPRKRDYPVARMPTTEAAIDYRIMRDLYVVIGDQQADGGWVMRTYIKPFANWIWAGCFLMSLGGVAEPV